MNETKEQDTFRERIETASITGFFTSILFFVALVSYIPTFQETTDNFSQYFLLPGLLTICVGVSFIPFSFGFYFGGRQFKQKSGILAFAMGLLFSICVLMVGAVELAFFIGQELDPYGGALGVTIGFAGITYVLFAFLEMVYFAGTEQGTLGGVLAGILFFVGPIIAEIVAWFVERLSPLIWAISGSIGFVLISYMLMRQADISFRELLQSLSSS